LFADSANVTREPGSPAAVSNAGEASSLAGFGVRLLADREAALTVQSASAFEVTIDRMRAQALLNEAGRSDLQLPQSLDGALIQVDIPNSVTAAYGACPSRSSGNFAGGPPEGMHRQPARDCVLLAQAPSPSVMTPPDVDIAALAELALQFAGLSADEARQFSQTVDWTTTLVVPIPTDAADYETVTVDGVSGTLVTGASRSGLVPYTLMWVKSDIIYALSGYGSAEEALALANSLQ
jgi:hypothetical protein